MTTPIGNSSTQYNMRDVHLSFVNEDVIQIIKKDDSGQESALIVDTSQLDIQDQMSSLKVCLQYCDQKTSKCLEMARENNRALEQLAGASTISSAEPC